MLFLILRVIASPVVNVFQKKMTDKGSSSIFIVTITYGFLTIFLLPFYLLTGGHGIEGGFWSSVIIAAAVDALGNIFQLKALKQTDLSVFGPVNSFKPIIAMIIAFFLISEIPGIYGLTGTLVIIAGSLFLSLDENPEGDGKKFNIKLLLSRAMLYRFTGIFLSSLGAVYSKKAIGYSSPETTLFFWALLGLPFLAIPLLILKRDGLQSNLDLVRKNLKSAIPLVVSYSLMQYFTLLTFRYSLVGYSLAIFQLSSIISVFFGYRIFREKNITVKIISSIIMIAGTLLILIPK